MDWKSLLNPWGEMRRLREQNANLEGRIDELREWAEKEVSRAFNRAADHYWQRNRHAEDIMKVYQQRMADIANTMPLRVQIADNLPPA